MGVTYTGDGFRNDPWGYLGSTLGRSQWVHEGHNVRKEKPAPPGGRGPGNPGQRAKAQERYNLGSQKAYQRGVNRLGAEQSAASSGNALKTVRKERGAIKAFDTSALQQARAKYGRGSKEAVTARRARRADYRAGTKSIRQTRRAARRAGSPGGDPANIPGPSNAAPGDTTNIFNPAGAPPPTVTTPPPPIMHVPNVLPTMGMNR